MASCIGDGGCFQLCARDCRCDGQCRCAHQFHVGGYCADSCPHGCALQECPNFAHCGTLEPQWVLEANQGMCAGCLHQFGRIVPAGRAVCALCRQRRNVMQVHCDAQVCFDCWLRHSETGQQQCPLCEDPIWS